MTLRDNRHLTPGAMPLLADRLEDTISKIEHWAGISISGSSRVAEAVGVLRSVAPSSAFSGSREDLTRVAHAVRDAQDFWVIGNMLGPQTLPPVVTALRDAIGGELGVTPHAAYRAQSELWVSAMIAASGTVPGVALKMDAKSPDVIIKNGTREYSVEVKRPRSLGHVRNMVSKATRQLSLKQADGVVREHFHGGALVVDLTDCLPRGWAVHFEHGPPVLDTLRSKHASLEERIHEQIFDDSSGRMRERRQHIFAAISLVRISWWNLSDLSQLHCIMQRLNVVYLTSGNRKTLRYHRAHWLAERIRRGLQEVGVESLGHGEIRFGS